VTAEPLVCTAILIACSDAVLLSAAHTY
jgi:hypothetical protein